MKKAASFRMWSLVTLALIADSSRASPDDVTHRCDALSSTDLSKTLDAPTKIVTSHSMDRGSDGQGYCQVIGYVTPNVGFLLRLPISWNGKFLQLGCGGYCGTTTGIAAGTGDFSMCIDSVRRGYACIVSDNGHSGDGALWAYNNLQAQIDHAYRGAHVTSLAGKAIVTRYYGQQPKKSYFWGCSTGGRQALMEAQRFPWDFDGIIAGDPTLGVPDSHMLFLWAARVLTDTSGKLIFEESDLEFLHQAVIEKCDLNDGVKDGLIGDPRKCDFDPLSLRCEVVKRGRCLTGKQIRAVQYMYSGPVTTQGIAIYTAVALKGSERMWRSSFSYGRAFANEEFRYDGFNPSPGPAWEAAEFDFDRDYKRLGIAKALYSAVNPDLREFKAAGGKMLAYQGWNGYAPLHMVDYYETVERTMGGRTETQEFFRLFAIPGMNHCTGGDGAFAVDWLSYLEGWLERGHAPDELLSVHVKLTRPNDGSHPDRLDFPLNPAVIVFSRPVYPYPKEVRYLGRGNIKDATSYGPTEP